MKIKHDEWQKKATRLYGEDAWDWKFKCPVCETVQTAKDFINAGASKEDASTSIAKECIGRYLEVKQKAFGDRKKNAFIKGEPCNYAGYGLLKLNPVEVEFEDGTTHNAFDFADEEKDATEKN